MKFVRKLFVVLIMMFALVALVGCGDDNPIENITKEEIVVNFDTQGGSAIDKVTLKVSDVTNFKLPEDPTKEGYAFIGWYLDANYKNEFKDLEAKKGEITLYAKWETVTSNSIVVKFETNGGSLINNVVINITNPDLSALAVVPVKAGEVFLGWYMDKDLTKAVNVVDIAKALSEKQITLYAKWGKEGETPIASGIKVSAEANVELHEDVTNVDEYWVSQYDESGSYTGEEEVRTVENFKIDGTAKLSVDCAVSATKLEKFEDLGLALTIKVEIDFTEAGTHYEEPYENKIPETEFKLYLANGVLYGVIPAEVVGSDVDLCVMVDLVKVYNDNIETVKEYLKAAMDMLKELPAEELPEGFDLSILDRIDIDNLKIEDLLSLVDLLPEEFKDLLENPEEASFEGILSLVEGLLFDQLPVELNEDQIGKLNELLEQLFNVLKGFLPTITENGGTTKVELTDSQVKDAIDSLAAFVKDNIADIMELSELFVSDHEDDYILEDGEDVLVEESDGEGDDEVYELTPEDIAGMIDAYVELIKKAFEIKEAYAQVTVNAGFPTNAKAALEAEVHVDGAEYELFGMDPEENIDYSVKALFNADAELLLTGIEYPDFTSFMDMTETVSATVAEMLDKVFNGGEDDVIDDSYQ